MRTLYVVAILVAVFSALVLYLDNRIDPKETNALIKDQGYHLKPLTAPRLAGLPLQVFAITLNTPLIGTMLASYLYKDNKFDMIKKFAAGLDFSYPPTAFPNTKISKEAMQKHVETQTKNVEKSYLELVNSIKHEDGRFRFPSSSDYVKLYKSGKVTPLDITKKLLAAIESSNKTLNAWNQLNVDQILNSAGASAARYAKGKELGPLDGVPVAVKDEVDVKDYYTSFGTGFKKTITKSDAAPVERLRDAGAIIFGKTIMHELGMGTSGINFHFGTPKNPYDINKYPGGSSSGSAVAAASGLVPIAIGCDGGGSVRIPSSLTGLFGIKATFGRVPHAEGLCHSVCHIGPMTGNFEDMVLAYAVMSGGHKEDIHSLEQPPLSIEGLVNTDVKGLRIGIYKEHYENASPSVLKAVKEATDFLVKRGAILVDISIPYLHVISKAQTLIITSEIAGGLTKDLKKNFYDYSPEIHIVFGMTNIYTAEDLMSSMKIRTFAHKLIKRIFGQVDIMLTPTTSFTAFSIPKDIASHGESDVTSTGKMMTYAPLANMVGYPSMTIPVGYDENGMPIGLQIESDMWQENILLRVANLVDREITSKIRQKPKNYYGVL